jgi:diguanylate cyclase (GGDEF)-like protein
LHEALEELFGHYKDHLAQLERLTSIADGYGSMLRQRNDTLEERYRKQLRQLQKTVRISDHYQQMLRDLNEALKVSSTQDPLTGLPNRRLMLERLVSETALAERHQQPFSIALMDVDRFKNVNDTWGHAAGDAVLARIGHVLASGMRAYDVCARWGGEEFLILLPETNSSSARDVAQRLLNNVASLEHSTDSIEFNQQPAGVQHQPYIRATISAGIAQHQAGTLLAHTIKRADTALYKAKHQGRNRVVISE